MKLKVNYKEKRLPKKKTKQQQPTKTHHVEPKENATKQWVNKEIKEEI